MNPKPSDSPSKTVNGASDDELWRIKLRAFFDQTSVELAVAALVALSVVLTLAEFTFSAYHGRHAMLVRMLEVANDLITLVFIIELSLRFLAAHSKLRYLRYYWIDIIAVLPLFRVFRAVRLLRLIRVLRLFGVATRLASNFPYILRRGALEYFVVIGLLAVTVLFGTGAMMYFERDTLVESAEDPSGENAVNGEVFSFEYSLWFSIYSLFAGEPVPGPPRTMGGKVVAVFVMFMGLTIFAMFTGTVSAFMVERLRSEGQTVDWEQLRDHVIICGWNSKAEIIVQEFRLSQTSKEMPIVVIWEFGQDRPVLPPALQKNVYFLSDDFTRVLALEQAGIHRAKICIVLADTSGVRNEQDADARTILAALTVEKLNPAVYTCAELINRSYGSHLKMGNVNDYVVSGEYGAYLLAQAAMNRGLMSVFSELLTYKHGNELYRMPLPPTYYGKSFLDLLVELKEKYNAILLGVHPQGGEMQVNPLEHTFEEGDDLVVVALDEFEFK